MPRFRACANYGCKAPAANAFLTRKGAFAGKDRRLARMGGGGENASAIVTRRAETLQGLGGARYAREALSEASAEPGPRRRA